VKATAFISSAAAAAQLFASNALAQCEMSPAASHTIVRGRFVRCEDASFYLEAAGAYQRYERDFAAALARAGPQNRESLLERLGVTAEFPYDASLEGRVAVVAVDWHASIAPWARGTSQAVEFKEAPREIRETIRYWWRGPIETCEELAEWLSIDLWVYQECCDTFEFGAPVCQIRMSYAEPAPDAMKDALTQAVGGP
jgi:hypothetical protein